MMSEYQGEGAAKRKRSIADEAVEKYVGKTRTKAREEANETPATEKYANIESNPFHQIVIQSSMSPTEKKNAVAKALAFEEDKPKEENEAKIQAFEEFKEYLMAYRKEMSKEIIRLSDTEAFSELQKVFEEMNSALQDFETQITPLVEIIDAVHRLNVASDGAMYDVFKEIQEDKAEEERVAKLREEQTQKLQTFEGDVTGLQQDIAALRQQKSWFGFGGTKKTALEEIARKQVLIENKQTDISDLRQEIESTVVSRESKFGDLAVEKDKLRELLDLTSDEHKERQESLVRAALNFVNTTENRTAAVLEHMVGIKDQIKNVDTVNGSMKRIFAVVNDGIKDAEELDKSLTEKFKVAAEGESQLQQFEREDKLQAVNEHVESLTTSKVDTLSTLGELQEESMNIKSMRDTNNTQITNTRKMHSSGTAGVASRLSTVLTAVSAAALNEAKTTTQNTLKGMNKITHEIAQNEAIKNATNLHTQNDELSRAIEQLATYREVSDKATEITRAALQEQKDLQREMEQTAEELAKSIKEAKGVTAEVMQGGERAERGSSKPANDLGKKKPATGNSPFASFKL